MSKRDYVHYGCGLSAPETWINFDASPTLRIQHLPLIGWAMRSHLNVIFPGNVKYGNIVSGLPGLRADSCSGVYCSHVLEHLALNDFRKAMKNTYSMLKPGGIFRLVVPDLQYYIDEYCSNKEENAAIHFMESTILGSKARKKGIKGVLEYLFGNSKHLWMWDFKSMKEELESSGFIEIRRCQYGDSQDAMFLEVEDPGRFNNALAIECFK